MERDTGRDEKQSSRGGRGPFTKGKSTREMKKEVHGGGRKISTEDGCVVSVALPSQSESKNGGSGIFEVAKFWEKKKRRGEEGRKKEGSKGEQRSLAAGLTTWGNHEFPRRCKTSGSIGKAGGRGWGSSCRKP